tara:strand:- start:130 stop:1236 length:1107 start_codon:yes stop_codon:yes gene_type:complete
MNLNDLENSNKFFEEGNSKYDAENLEGALSDYTKSIYFNPNNVDAFFNRGCVRKELQKFESAKSDFSKVIYFSPNNEIAFFNRGEIFFDLKDYFSAIDDFSKAILLNNDFEDAYLKRGLSKSRINNIKGAIEDFSRAIEINPGFVEAIYSRGLVKIKLSDITGEKDLNHALKIQPDYVDIYFEKTSKYVYEDEKSNSIDIEVENPTEISFNNQKKLNFEKNIIRNSNDVNKSEPETSKKEKSNLIYENEFLKINEKKKKKKKIKKEDENFNVIIKNEKSIIGGRFLLILFLIISVITGILISNGLIIEAVIVAFLGTILLNLFALFWRPARKAIGLLNIIGGIIMMLSVIGIPFGVVLLLFGGILFFI